MTDPRNDMPQQAPGVGDDSAQPAAADARQGAEIQDTGTQQAPDQQAPAAQPGPDAEAVADAEPGPDTQSGADAHWGADPEQATAQADAAEQQAPGAEAQDEDPLAVLQRERDDYLDQLLRTRAEFDNFRKRVARERTEALDRGAERLVAGMLGVLDNLGFALDAADNSEDVQLAKGVQMVHAELMGVLGQAGLSEVPGRGAPFDPAVHEAVMQVEDEQAQELQAEQAAGEPVVVDVLRRGWMFKGRLLRPASVSVTGG